MANKLEEGVGRLSGRIVQDVLKSILPGVDLKGLETFKALQEGNLGVANKLGPDIVNRLINQGLEVGINPFYRSLDEVARSVVGAPFLYVASVGHVEGGMVTKAAAYTGEGEDFELAGKIAGTLGIWETTRRGGYQVACIAAHPLGERGYVALLGVSVGTEQLGMSDVVKRFGFEKLRGHNLVGSQCPLSLTCRDPRLKKVVGGLQIYKAEKQGEGCVAAYKLK